MREAAQLHRNGRLAEAIELYRRVIKAAPKTPEAHNNLATALNAAGRPREALASYRRAVKLRPGYAVAQSNMGALLVLLGKTDEGLEHLASAYLVGAKPTARADDGAARDRLLANLAQHTPKRAGPRLRTALDRLAEDPMVDPQSFADSGAALLLSKAPVAKLLKSLEGIASDVLDAGMLPRSLYETLAAPMPLVLLSDALIANAEFETLLVALRRLWLAQACGVADGAPPPQDLLAAVALQAAASEWVWPESATERDQVDLLVASVIARDPEAILDEALITIALYRPLKCLPKDQRDVLRKSVRPLPAGPVRDLLVRDLVEPSEEAVLAAALPRLTEIADETSLVVQAQYEANAYPRWRRIASRPARPLADVLQAAVPGASLALPLAQAPRVLVAGCGTGRHALATATRFSGAQVVAIDLSRASLGFAARQARDLGIGNIEFAQADILGLAALEQRFDLIECSGTLHHMSDPEAGWRILRGLLAPRGVMRISLYSERGRADVVAMREMIAREGWQPTAEGIRSARAAWRSPSNNEPVPALTESADFFSMSGCRDMLFHEQEVRFDLPRIARDLAELDLVFLGFEFPSESIRRAFETRFPAPDARRDLAAWDEFEAENPTIFAAMYQFWCQAG
jgi:SAM-dependent methyltransferase